MELRPILQFAMKNSQTFASQTRTGDQKTHPVHSHSGASALDILAAIWGRCYIHLLSPASLRTHRRVALVFSGEWMIRQN